MTEVDSKEGFKCILLPIVKGVGTTWTRKLGLYYGGP